MADASPPATVKSAMRTLDIIEYIVSRGRPLVAQEIASALAIPVSSLSYLLSTLVERDYLIRAGRRYSAGPGLERLQAHAPAFTLAETVAPLVRTVRIQLNETTSFFVRRGWEAEALLTETSEHALRYAIGTGTNVPLHAISAGKVLLAALEEEELSRYFAESERQRFTPTTITSEPALRAELAAIRDTGVAHTVEEHTPGIHGLGRIVLIDGEPVGAISVAIPTVRFNETVENHVIDLLTRVSGLLE